MRSAAQIGQAIETIASATADEAPWSDVGAALMRLVGAESCALWVGDPSRGRVEILHSNFGEPIERDYNAHYHKVDLWAHRGQHLTGPRPFLGSEIVSDAEFRSSKIYTDLFRKRGAFHLLASVVPVSPSAGILAVALHRPEQGRAFGGRQQDALARLLPHFGRSARLRHELRQARGAAQLSVEALAATGSPSVVVDADCRLVFVSYSAMVMVRRARGLTLRNGRLSCIQNANDSTLRHTVERVVSGDLSRPQSIAVRGDGSLLHLSVMGCAEHRLAIVSLIDPATPRLGADVDILRKLFGLTQAEAEVAIPLARGVAAPAIANLRAVSETTVRAQVRTILDKTGAANLRALAAMIAALPVVGSGR